MFSRTRQVSVGHWGSHLSLSTRKTDPGALIVGVICTALVAGAACYVAHPRERTRSQQRDAGAKRTQRKPRRSAPRKRRRRAKARPSPLLIPFVTAFYSCLSAAGIRFLPHPVPSEGLALLCSRVTDG